MAESTGTKKNAVPILLGVIVVLLIAIVVGLVIKGNGKTASTTNAGSTATTSSASTSSTANQAGMASSTSSSFDPATATKVPSGMQPKDFVKKYYQSILNKQWAAAFKMQPAASQKGGTVADFQSTQEMYGMTAFQVTGSNVQNSAAQVSVSQNLGSNGMWTAMWTFAKYKGGWVVESRQVGMASSSTTTSSTGN